MLAMPIPDFAQGIQSSFLATMSSRAQNASGAALQSVDITPVAGTAVASQSGGGESFLGDLLDVINPLQHLPVISTLYRAITGDKIGDVEQVAGDALYGGLVGLGASVANLIFKDATGKNFGDTVLAWAEDATGIGTGSSQPTAVAANPPAAPAASSQVPTQTAASQAPAAVTPAQSTALPTVLTDPAAFMDAVKAHGIDPSLGMRAMDAYEKSLGLSAPQP